MAQHDLSCWQIPATTSRHVAVTRIRSAVFCPEVGPGQVVAILGPTPVFYCPLPQLTEAIAMAAVGIHLEEAWLWHLGLISGVKLGFVSGVKLLCGALRAVLPLTRVSSVSH